MPAAVTPGLRPVVLALRGTGCDADSLLDEAGLQPFADVHGAVVLAPTPEAQRHGDWDHSDGTCYWDTTDLDPNVNNDILFARALLSAAWRDLRGDPARTYVLGHSNGAFFAVALASVLRNRFAAMATNAGGLVPCATTASCAFVARGHLRRLRGAPQPLPLHRVDAPRPAHPRPSARLHRPRHRRPHGDGAVQLRPRGGPSPGGQRRRARPASGRSAHRRRRLRPAGLGLLRAAPARSALEECGPRPRARPPT